LYQNIFLPSPFSFSCSLFLFLFLIFLLLLLYFLLLFLSFFLSLCVSSRHNIQTLAYTYIIKEKCSPNYIKDFSGREIIGGPQGIDLEAKSRSKIREILREWGMRDRAAINFVPWYILARFSLVALIARLHAISMHRAYAIFVIIIE